MRAALLRCRAAQGGKGDLVDKKETILLDARLLSVIDNNAFDAEPILLDARLLSVIDNNAFDAELSNGHRFTAFFGRGERDARRPESGDCVMVEMSPYDMSKGRLVANQD